MTVYVGGASIDENGKAYGGKAGNQTGRELKKQSWYKHSKGWRVFRATDAAKAKKIAKCVTAAIANKHIGYDQWQRNTLYKEAEQYGFDVSKVAKDVECDCSALVRVACAYAGIRGLPSDFRTGNMPGNLMKTGHFVEMMGSKYTGQSDYLCEGDILVTASAGHTVVVLNDGPKAERKAVSVAPAEEKPTASATLGSRILKKGMTGADVKQMQTLLVDQGYKLPKYGADGDFGSETDSAVRSYQSNHALEVDGEVGPKTLAALKNSQPDKSEKRRVRITGGMVNVRSAPNLNARIIGIVEKGDELPYQGQTDANGWHLVEYNLQNAWVSGKFAELL